MFDLIHILFFELCKKDEEEYKTKYKVGKTHGMLEFGP